MPEGNETVTAAPAINNAAAPAASAAQPAEAKPAEKQASTDWEAEAKAAKKEAQKAAKAAEDAAKRAQEHESTLEALKNALGAGKKEDPLEKLAASTARAQALEQRLRSTIVRDALREMAGDAYDVADVLHNIPASALDVDVDAGALKSADAVKAAVDEVRAKKPHLFKPAPVNGEAARGAPMPAAVKPPAAKTDGDGVKTAARPTDLYSRLTAPVRNLVPRNSAAH